MRRKLRRVQNENEASFQTILNDSPQKVKVEQYAQQRLEEISRQCNQVSQTIDLYSGWDGQEHVNSPIRIKPHTSQKSTLDQSFRIKHLIRNNTSAVNRKQRTQSFNEPKEILKENRLHLNVCPRMGEYPMPAFRSKQYSMKEQIKYFREQTDKDDRVIVGLNSLIQVKSLMSRLKYY